ncbi:hypothetical protein CTI12_AA340140 [Artemisia annua]|uniref:Uncharacterized protein n=1 Tax=Artemisia annua TaxID=35608 RepID=A0A2U1MTC8_ARTAN|nr:hypothetical protein CTI12_AA340140 [Artemisia annua]
MFRIQRGWWVAEVHLKLSVSQPQEPDFDSSFNTVYGGDGANDRWCKASIFVLFTRLPAILFFTRNYEFKVGRGNLYSNTDFRGSRTSTRLKRKDLERRDCSTIGFSLYKKELRI